MKIYINQVISNTLDEQRKLIRTLTNESYLVYPDEGKVIRNKITQRVIEGHLCLLNLDELDNYEEIDAN